MIVKGSSEYDSISFTPESELDVFQLGKSFGHALGSTSFTGNQSEVKMNNLTIRGSDLWFHVLYLTEEVERLKRDKTINIRQLTRPD